MSESVLIVGAGNGLSASLAQLCASKGMKVVLAARNIEKLRNLKTNSITELKIDGLFIAIGHDPATALFKDQLDMDKEGYLITKPDSTITNIPGIFAAGDVKDKIFRQAVTAAGTGCMAALEAEKHLSHIE